MSKVYFQLLCALLMMFINTASIAQFEAKKIFEGRRFDEVTNSGYFHLVDLDNDGDLEISVGTGMYDIVDGSLKWNAYQVTLSALPETFSDLDDNGIIDCFVSSSLSPDWCEDLNSPFQNPNLFSDYGSMTFLFVHDFDNDGLDDLVFKSGLAVYILRNLGGMQFEENVVYSYDSATGTIRNLIVDDFDLDGDLDIVLERRTTSYSTGTLNILHNTSNGSIQFETESIDLDYQHVIENTLERQLVSGDFNGDGYPDLFNRRILLFNNTQGSFSPSTFSEMEDEIFSSGTAWIAKDINNDGTDELFRENGQNEEAYIKMYVYQDNDWSLQSTIQTTYNPVTPDNNDFSISGFDFIDFNEDGVLDIISNQYGSIIINPGLGNYEFGEPETLYHHVNPDDYHLADIDSDQDLDILLIDGPGIYVCYNDQGSFSAPLPLIKLHEPYEFANLIDQISSVALVDVNQDDQIDIIIGHRSLGGSGNSISEFLNQDGTFPVQTIITAELSTPVVQLYAGIYDGDGDPGIFYAKEQDGSYCIPYENGWLDPLYIHSAWFHPKAFGPTRASSNKFIFYNPIGGLAEYTWLNNIGFVDYDAIGTGFDSTDDIEFLDLFNDGYPEIIYNDYINFYEENQIEYINHTSNGYSSLSSTLLDDAFERTDGGFELEDINGDGFPDLTAVATYNEYHVSIATRFNNGSNDFDEVSEVHFLNENPIWYDIHTAFNLEDLDGDGDQEGILLLDRLGNSGVLYYFENVFGEGCTDPSACNFDPDAFENNNSCCYGVCGCMDPSAYNFDPDAECSLDICTYAFSGVVYHDQNGNGDRDEGEPGIDGITVIDQLSNNTSISNQEGEFIFLMDTSANLQVINNDAFPGVSTPAVVAVSEFGSTNVEFGLSTEVQVPEFAIEIIPEQTGYPCDAWVEHIIHIHNQGNLPLSGSVEFEFDALFQNFQEISAISEASDQSVIFDFELINPGLTHTFHIDLRTPDVFSIGELLHSSSTVYAFYNGNILAAVESDDITIEMTCAYDPNDKQAFPVGYEEPNFILPQTEIEYLVRFQNTGNAPATTVLIQDTISPMLDLDSFELRSSSHSVSAFTDHEDNVVNFLFEDINLPDSTSNEPESHGFITFTLHTSDNLEPDDEIFNTAFIYFDNNPAIITNQYHHTIFECSSDLASFDAITALCANEELSFINSAQFVEEFLWTLNGDTLSNINTLNHTFETGEYELQLAVSNPICEVSSNQNIIVLDYPQAEISYEDFVLSANTEDHNYQWFFNGSPIESANNATYTPQNVGLYYVVVTNDGNCSATSNEINVLTTSIDQVKSESIQVFPNPTQEVCIIQKTNSAQVFISIKDSSGKIAKQLSSSEDRTTISVSDLAKGIYIVEIVDEDEHIFRSRLVIN